MTKAIGYVRRSTDRQEESLEQMGAMTRQNAEHTRETTEAMADSSKLIV